MEKNTMKETDSVRPANPHVNHRQRMRNRLITAGDDGFGDYELLEMLLYCTIPRANTNVQAHDLLKRFSTLSRLFRADVAELKKTSGLGQKSCEFIHFLGTLYPRYAEEQENFWSGPSWDRDNMGKCLHKMAKSIDKPTFRAVIFDGLSKERGFLDLDITDTEEALQSLYRFCICNETEMVLFLSVHPGGVADITREEMHFLQDVLMGFKRLGIFLLMCAAANHKTVREIDRTLYDFGSMY